MASLFDDLCEGLNEAIEYEKGNGSARVIKYVFMPVHRFSSEEIRKIRMQAGMTQATFSSYLGVSPKTVEAWENGRTAPTGPACRLIEMLSDGASVNLPFVRQM